MECSLQLYSLICGGIKEVDKQIEIAGQHGYDGVEICDVSVSDYSSEEINEMLQKANLYAKSTHLKYCGKSDEEMEKFIDFYKNIGVEYIIQPWATIEKMEDIENVSSDINRFNSLAKKYGIKVGYHNHVKEFEIIDGKYILEHLKDKTDKDVVFEIDVFWVQKAGEDPYTFIEKMGERAELIHLKQIDENGKNVDLEDGIIDIKKVRDSAKYAKYFIVEQEKTANSIESSRHNAHYLKSL